MNCCDSPIIADMFVDFHTVRINKGHLFCYRCKSHLYQGKLYTKEEWAEYLSKTPFYEAKP